MYYLILPILLNGNNLNEVVPDILTGKDVDYLTDMFNWNYGALKKTNNYYQSLF